MQGQDWKSTGSCTLADAEGDLLFEDVSEGSGTGQGKLTGGTGQFAGITGEHAITRTLVLLGSARARTRAWERRPASGSAQAM